MNLSPLKYLDSRRFPCLLCEEPVGGGLNHYHPECRKKRLRILKERRGRNRELPWYLRPEVFTPREYARAKHLYRARSRFGVRTA